MKARALADSGVLSLLAVVLQNGRQEGAAAQGKQPADMTQQVRAAASTIHDVCHSGTACGHRKGTEETQP